MVSAMINISKDANQVLNVVKAKYGLKDKSQAIEKVVLMYAQEVLDQQLRPEFIQRMQQRKTDSKVVVKDFDTHFNV